MYGFFCPPGREKVVRVVERWPLAGGSTVSKILKMLVLVDSNNYDTLTIRARNILD